MADESKKPTLEQTIAALKKKNPDLRLGPMSEVAVEVAAVSTGNIAIDHITGVGGLPLGRSIELYGLPSCGKTTTALQAAATLQAVIKAGGDEALGIRADDVIAYFDFEQAMDPNYAAALGLDCSHESFVFVQPDTLEQAGDISIMLIETGRVRMQIFDSVAAMVSEAAMEGDTSTSALQMRLANVFSNYLRKLNVKLRDFQVVALFINHLMEKTNIGGRPGAPPQETTTGGKMLKYMASMRIKYTIISQIKVSQLDELTGEMVSRPNAAKVAVRVMKNKVAPPFQEAEVMTRFGKGFDNLWSAVQVLVTAKQIVAGAGGYFYFEKCVDLVHDDMERQKTGNHRPFIQTVERVVQFGDEHPEWVATAVRLAKEYLANRKLVGTPDPEIDPESSEDKSVSLPSTAANGLLTGPGDLLSLVPEGA